MNEDQVTFQAPHRTAPLSWGQLCILKPLLAYGSESTYFNVAVAARLDAPIGSDRFRAAIRRLVGRHESLRTAVMPLSLHGEQVVRGKGAIHVVRTPPGEAGSSVVAELDKPFDLSKGEVVRFVVEEDAAGIWAVHALISHFVADGHAVDLLATALREALEDADGEPGVHRGAVDLAIAEQGAATLARSERGVERWLTHLARAAEPGATRHEPQQERWVRLRLESQALPEACATIVQHLRVGESAPVLGAVLAVLGRRLGHDYRCAKVIVKNRLRPGDDSLLTPMVQDGVVGWLAADDLETEIVRASKEMILAAITSHYDPNALDDAVEARWPDAHVRPAPLVLFNDVRMIRQASSGLAAPTSARSVEVGRSTVQQVASYPYQDCTAFVTVRNIGDSVGVDLLIDTAVISVDEATADLYEVDRLVVDLATARSEGAAA